jgi:hypothetical protein
MRHVDDCRTAEQKAVTNWDDASCTMQKQCRPHLIGIRDSALVSLNCSNSQNLLSRCFEHGAKLLGTIISVLEATLHALKVQIHSNTC